MTMLPLESTTLHLNQYMINEEYNLGKRILRVFSFTARLHIGSPKITIYRKGPLKGGDITFLSIRSFYANNSAINHG